MTKFTKTKTVNETFLRVVEKYGQIRFEVYKTAGGSWIVDNLKGSIVKFVDKDSAVEFATAHSS